MGDNKSEPRQFAFNGFLKVAFQGSRVTSDAGLVLVRIRDQPDRTLVELQQALPTSASLPTIWRAVTKLVALRVTGLTAPAVFDGPIDGVSFLAYIEHGLAPTLRPGDVVVRDNLSVHRSPAVRAAVERVGATLCFLPKYSPDLNPIELCFAKLKTILRVARWRAREELWATIGACVPRFAPTECWNYFRHCGYSGATRS